jgi:hypothetical protein
MGYPFSYKIQEWLARRVKRVQYPRQQFIPKNQLPRKEMGWLDNLAKLMIFGFAMWWIFGSCLAVAAFFVIACIGSS